MRPRSKTERLVTTGLNLMHKAETESTWTPFRRARQYRNGLMIALLACSPIRLKNFAALLLDTSFRKIREKWWICLRAGETKERRPDERPVPEFLQVSIEAYLTNHRSRLARKDTSSSLWLSSN